MRTAPYNMPFTCNMNLYNDSIEKSLKKGRTPIEVTKSLMIQHLDALSDHIENEEVAKIIRGWGL